MTDIAHFPRPGQIYPYKFKEAWKRARNQEMSRVWKEFQFKERPQNAQERPQKEGSKCGGEVLH